VSYDLGGGSFAFALIGSGEARLGSLSLKASNTAGETGSISLAKVAVDGAVSMLTGAGADSVDMTDSIFNSTFTLSTFGGADTITVETVNGGRASLFKGAVAIATGDGNDLIRIGANTATGHANFLAGVKIDGGADSDTANVSTANFANIYPAGQPVLVNIEANS
jgi:hypothetical protein